MKNAYIDLNNVNMILHNDKNIFQLLVSLSSAIDSCEEFSVQKLAGDSYNHKFNLMLSDSVFDSGFKNMDYKEYCAVITLFKAEPLFTQEMVRAVSTMVNYCRVEMDLKHSAQLMVVMILVF